MINKKFFFFLKSLPSLFFYFLLLSILPFKATAQMEEQLQNQLPVEDKDFPCLSLEQADKYIHAFGIDIESFGGKELCNFQVDSKKLFNDLSLIENGTFSSQFSGNSSPLIRGFIPIDNYYNWLQSETNGIQRGNDIPYATAYNRGGYFTMQNGWTHLSTLGRVGTVIHEARHTEGYGHIPCNQGPYMSSGLAGCDRTYEYAGSHAIEMEYYARVSILGQNFHPIYKTMARLMGVARANFVFNSSPIKRRESLLARDQTGQILLFDRGTLYSREAPPYTTMKLKRTSFGASLFDGLQAFALEMYENSKINSPFNYSISDDYSYFKLLKEKRGQGEEPLLDVEEFDQKNKRYFFLLNQSKQISSYNFPSGKFSGKVQAPYDSEKFITYTPQGNYGLYLKTLFGEIYSINPDNINSISKISEIWPSHLVKVITLNSVILSLNDSGQVFMRENSGLEQEFPFFINNPIEDILAIPMYDAFEVKKD